MFSSLVSAQSSLSVVQVVVYVVLVVVFTESVTAVTVTSTADVIDAKVLSTDPTPTNIPASARITAEVEASGQLAEVEASGHLAHSLVRTKPVDIPASGIVTAEVGPSGFTGNPTRTGAVLVADQVESSSHMMLTRHASPSALTESHSENSRFKDSEYVTDESTDDVKRYGQVSHQKLVRALTKAKSHNDAETDSIKESEMEGHGATPTVAKSLNEAPPGSNSIRDSDGVEDVVESDGQSVQQRLVRQLTKPTFRNDVDSEGQSTVHQADMDTRLAVDASTQVQDTGMSFSEMKGEYIFLGLLLFFLIAKLFVGLCGMLYMWSIDEQGARDPTKGMKMDLVVQVKDAALSFPEPHGVQLYVEVRCVKFDPSTKPGGGIDEASQAKGRTHSKQDNEKHVWNETITLSKVVYDPQTFVNILLWDSEEQSGNRPLGYQSIALTQLLSGLRYDPHDPDGLADKEFTANAFASLLADTPKVLPASLNLSIGYAEVHKFEVSIAKGTHLPVNGMDSLDAFVEIRILKDDPLVTDFHCEPHEETVWHGRTKVVRRSLNPEFKDDSLFIIAANPAHYMVLCVIDESSKTADEHLLSGTPQGMIVVPMREIMIKMDGIKAVFDRPLQKLPNWPAPPDLEQSRLHFSISHKPAISNLS
jgi:hypothetical protein